MLENVIKDRVLDAKCRSRFILGTWGLSGEGARPNFSYGETSESTMYQVLDLAWESGLRCLDTAWSYGDGVGLRRIARWQKSAGVEWNIIAKLGRKKPDVSRFDLPSLKILMEEYFFYEELLGSPKTILIKDPPVSSYKNGSLDELICHFEKAIDDANFGVASHHPELISFLNEGQRPRIAQVELNGINRALSVPEVRTIDAKLRNWKVWSMQPLAYGFISDPDRMFKNSDWRFRISDQSQQTFRAFSRLFRSRLEKLLPEVDPTVSAIAYCLSVPGIDRTVIGPKNCQQLKSSLSALQLLDDQVVRERLHSLIETEFPKGV